MAAKVFQGGTAGGNWNNNANWVGGAFAIAGDTVTFSANANTCIINVASACTSIDFTGWSGLYTGTNALTVAGNVTLSTGMTFSGTCSLIVSAAATLTSNGKTWSGTTTFSGANTKTLSGDWSITGLLTISAATTINTATLNLAGGFNHSAAAVVGTTTINLTGGTWTGAAGSATVSNPVTIAGNVTLSTNVGLGSGASLTYNSGAVTTTSNTLIIAASCTLNTAGISFNNVTVTGAATITNNSLFTATGTYTINTSFAVTWAGTSGFLIATYTDNNNSARTQTFANSVTYTITTALNCFKGAPAIVIMTSDHASLRANFVLQNASTICNVCAAFTRIDASAGARPINTFNGTVTDSPNVLSYSNVLYKPPTSFNRGARRLQLTNKNKAVMYQ